MILSVLCCVDYNIPPPPPPPQPQREYHIFTRMTNTTTMQEQIQMSGLEITSTLPSSSSSLPLQSNTTNQWSPLLGGGREEC